MQSPPHTPSTTRPKLCSPSSSAARGPKALRGIYPVLECRKGRFFARYSAPRAPKSRPTSTLSASPGGKTLPTATSPSRATASAMSCCRCSKPGTPACASTSHKWPHSPATKRPGGRPNSPGSPAVLMTGRPVRGGGRAAGMTHHALHRRYPARRACPGPAAPPPPPRRRPTRMPPRFSGTEALRAMASPAAPARSCELAQGLRAERTHRELRLTVGQITDRIHSKPRHEPLPNTP